VGQSGAGKATLLYNLLRQVTVPFWCFDLKQDYRHFIADDVDVLVIPWRQFKFNPLKPPAGTPPRRWAQVIAEIFGHATALLSGSKNYLLKQLLTLYDYYDLFTAVEPPYPSLFELQQLLAADNINYVRKTADYCDTVQNRLDALTSGQALSSTAARVIRSSSFSPATSSSSSTGWRLVFNISW